MIVFKWTWLIRNVTMLFDNDTTDKNGARAISFLCFIILRDNEDKESMSYKVLINHEKIHFEQQLEMMFVFNWLFYIVFHLTNGYDNNPFELEAYDHEDDLTYLADRTHYKWIEYIR